MLMPNLRKRPIKKSKVSNETLKSAKLVANGNSSLTEESTKSSIITEIGEYFEILLPIFNYVYESTLDYLGFD